MFNKIIGLSIIGITLITVTFGVSYQNMVAGDGASEVAANIPYATDSSKTFSEHYNLVANSDLLIPQASPNANRALGFGYTYLTDISLVNGIAKFTATANFGRMFRNDVNIDVGETVYYFARVKTSNDNTRLYRGNYFTSVPNTNSFEFISVVITPINSTNIQLIGVYDNSFSNFTPIEVDYMGAINITDLVSCGILPSGLTDARYKTILDDKVRDGSPYFNFNLEYDFSTSGSGFYSAVSNFLSWLGTIGDVVNNSWLDFSEFITQVYPNDSNNFILAFSDERFLELGGFTDEVPFWTNFRSKWDQADYDILYSHFTDLEKIWLGSLTPETHQSLPYHTAYFSYTEKLLLGLTPKAISETDSLWEKCVAYVASL